MQDLGLHHLLDRRSLSLQLQCSRGGREAKWSGGLVRSFPMKENERHNTQNYTTTADPDHITTYHNITKYTLEENSLSVVSPWCLGHISQVDWRNFGFPGAFSATDL